MAKRKATGLGDTIENVLQATGIDKVAKFILGEDCGCDERKEKLNKWKPYIECLNHNEYNYLKEWFESNRQTINVKQRNELITIYNRIFNKKQKDTSCGSCVRGIVNDLKRVYNEYLTNE